jgi:Domain of unknown function (DUF4386)
MTDRTVEASPRPRARIAGLFYLLVFLTGGLAVPSFRLVVDSDAAATASNILAHEALFRLGFATLLIDVVLYIAVTLLFYELFKPVNRSLSLLAAFFSLVGCAIQAVSSAFFLTPLVVLGGTQSLSVFKVGELQAQALMFFKLYAQAYNIGLVFFGFYCLLIGYLIFRSTFLPRILGALMAFAGLAWLTFLSPPLANYLLPYNMAVGALAELSLTLWLLVMGVKVERWRAQACAPGE